MTYSKKSESLVTFQNISVINTGTFNREQDPEAQSRSGHCITCFKFSAAWAELAS